MEDAEKRELKKGVNLRVERGVSQGVKRGVEKNDKYIINI